MEVKDLNPESLDKASNMLKAMAHPIRISIIGCLEEGKEKSVTEIHKFVGIEQSTASHHLGIMRDRGILGSRREGKNTFYFMKNEHLLSLLKCIGDCCK